MPYIPGIGGGGMGQVILGARQNALEKSRDEVLRRLEAASEGVAAALGAAGVASTQED